MFGGILVFLVLTGLCSSVNPNQDTIVLLQNIISNISTTNTFVIVGSKDQIPNFQQLRGEFVVITFEYHILTPLKLGLIKESTIEANVQPVYLIICSKKENGTIAGETVMNIRNVQHAAKILIIYEFDAKEQIRESLNFGVYQLFQFSPFQHLFNLYEICQYCENGRDNLNLINAWDPIKGFKNNFSLPSSFKGTFKGSTLKLGCPENRMWVWNLIDKDYIGILQRLLYFQTEIIHPSDGLGGSVVNGTPNGVMAQVWSRKSDIGICYNAADLTRFDFVDFTPNYDSMPNVIVSAKPPKGITKYAIIKPYGWFTWVLILISLIATSIIYYITLKTNVEGEAGESNSNVSYGDCLFDMVQILLWDSFTKKNIGLAAMILLVSFQLFVLVLISAYMGSVTSFIITPEYLFPPIDTLEQLKESDRKWLALDGYHGDMFNFDPLMKSKRELIASKDGSPANYIHGIDKVHENPSQYVLIASDGVKFDMMGSYMDGDGNMPFYFGKEPMGSVSVVFFLSKLATYKKEISISMTRMRDFGLMNKIRSDFDFNFITNSKRKGKELGRNFREEFGVSIELVHLQGAFMMWGIGLLASLVIFVAEYIIFIIEARKLASTGII